MENTLTKKASTQIIKERYNDTVLSNSEEKVNIWSFLSSLTCILFIYKLMIERKKHKNVLGKKINR